MDHYITFPKKEMTRRGLSLAVMATGASFMVIMLCSTAWAQFSNVEYLRNPDGTESPSATDLLNRKTTVGRFGSTTRGGWLAPEPGENSRFASGAVHSPGGGFIGLGTNTPNSRFQAWWRESEMPQAIDYSIYSDYLAMKRSGQLEVSPSSAATVGPIQASPPQPQSVSKRSGLSYYDSLQYQKDFGMAGSVGGSERSDVSRQSGPSRQLWMREGLAPARDARSAPLPGEGRADHSGIPRGADQGSRMTGSLAPASTDGSVSNSVESRQRQLLERQIEHERIASQEIRSQRAQQSLMASQAKGTGEAVESLQSSLELMLLRSPDVHPLSPIQVQLRDGVATVRGIVPSQANRVAAGRILLSDPRVKTVDNKLTVLPAKSGEPLPKIFDPALEKKP